MKISSIPVLVFFLFVLSGHSPIQTNNNWLNQHAISNFELAGTPLNVTEDGVEITAMNYLTTNLPNLKELHVDLKTLNLKNSPTGYHIVFAQLYKGVPIYDARLKLNLTKETLILSLFHKTADTRNWKLKISDTLSEIPERVTESYSAFNASPVIFITNNGPLEAIKIEGYKKNTAELIESIYNHKFELLHSTQLHRHLTLTGDSIRQVTAKVFLPDPLTTANTVYGGVYIDSNNANIPALNAERKLVTMEVKFLNDTFYLESPYIKFREMSPPVTQPVIRTDTMFYYGRGDVEFEDVNVFYHINHFQHYIQSLGFPDLMNKQVVVDARAFGGQDQSSHVFFNGEHRLMFGTGGVDDAEDADVILHEYTHALCEDASPFTYSGPERRALEEGLGDYFACSYSRYLDDFNWHKVFNWDGHNEFWAGRYCTNDKMYPRDMTNDMYSNGTIFVASLMDIWGDLGREETDKLVLHLIYNLAPNMRLSDAAKIIIQMDSLHNSGFNKDILVTHFSNRGFISVSTDTTKPLPKIDKVNIKPFDFTSGGSNIVIELPKLDVALIRLYTITGQQILSKEISGTYIYNLQVPGLSPGVYLMEIEYRNRKFQFKIPKVE